MQLVYSHIRILSFPAGAAVLEEGRRQAHRAALWLVPVVVRAGLQDRPLQIRFRMIRLRIAGTTCRLMQVFQW